MSIVKSERVIPGFPHPDQPTALQLQLHYNQEKSRVKENTEEI